MTIVGNQFQYIGDTSIDLQDIKGLGLGEEGSDYIKIWDPISLNYLTAYYFGNAMGGVYDDVNNTPEDYDDDLELGPGWGDGYQTALHANIAVGQGFWIKSVGGGKVSFPAVK